MHVYTIWYLVSLGTQSNLMSLNATDAGNVKRENDCNLKGHKHKLESKENLEA